MNDNKCDYLGLTKDRYEQMMSVWDNDETQIKILVNEWGIERCNKGYAIFDYDGTGMLEIEAINDIGCFDTDSEAVNQAVKDGEKIIPVRELPEAMGDLGLMWFGWIDTPENRKAINDFCEKYKGR